MGGKSEESRRSEVDDDDEAREVCGRVDGCLD